MATLKKGGVALTAQDKADFRAGIHAEPAKVPYFLVTGLGDSITQGNSGFTSEASFTVGGTCFEYVCRLSGGRLVRRKNAGVGGNTTAQMLARFDSDVPSNTTLGIVQGGTNDIGVLSDAETISNLRMIVRKFHSIGASVVVTGIPPKNTAANKTQTLNRMMASMSLEEGALFINPWAKFSDGNGQWISGASGDGVHPSQSVSRAAAVEWLKQFYQTDDVPQELGFWLPISNADEKTGMYISATANSCFMNDSNADGVPDGWSNAGGEITHSVLSSSYPVVGKVYRIAGASITAQRTTQRAMNLSSFQAGQRCILVFRVSTSLNSGACKARIVFIASGADVNAIVDFTEDVTNMVVVVPFTCISAPNTGYMQVSLAPVSGTTSGSLEISQAEVYKADDFAMLL